MKKLTKALAIILAAALVFSLAACDGLQEKEETLGILGPPMKGT